MGSTVIYEITVRDVLMDFIAEILISSKREQVMFDDFIYLFIVTVSMWNYLF